jgi:hypothetical protein
MIGDQNIQTAKTLYAGLNQGLGRLCTTQTASHRRTFVISALVHEAFGGGLGFFVIEEDAGTRLHEQADRRRPNAARPSGNQRNLTFQGKINGHG